MRGRFITFEGPEGGGKTTQARRLVEALSAEGRSVLYTREPGGTPTGEMIRGILQHHAAGEDLAAEAEVLLFAASRAQLVRTVILPALERGDWVVCDRFADSTTGYQGYGRGFPVETMETINRFAIGPAIPDLTLLLDLDVEAGMGRVIARQAGAQHLDRIEQESRAFHERVRQGYLELALREPERFVVVDASAEPDAVAGVVLQQVRRVLA